jgi:eukaryotic-like serine/threonine-protein kinase
VKSPEPPENAVAVAVATRSASPSAAGETRTSEPSTTATAPRDRHGATAQLGDPDRYQIISEYGRGGLGRVSRAHDRNLARDVAVKEIISRSPASEVRFLREALITARLEHPGIVPVYEAGRWPDGTPFYAMKLVAGRSLRELIAERTTVDERIALLHHVIAVADAMAYAHGRKVIHRDLKPANVIVGDFGETIVIDWGLAKELSAAEETTVADGPSGPRRDIDLTSTGSVLGTPAYMAPEQERGERVDQRADVFAIGAMLWEICSMHKVPPSDPKQRHRMLRRAGIDNDLVAIIDKAIDPDSRRRYRDAGALAADLKAFKSGARITARNYSLFAMLRHWVLRHRLLAVSAVAVVVLVAVWARAALQQRTAELEARMAQQETRAAQRVADVSVTVAAVEQGRQALLHGETADAEVALRQAYQRGDHSPGVAFMLARALQPGRAELAQLASTSGRMSSAAFSPDGRQIVTTDGRTAQVWDAESYKPLFPLRHGEQVGHAVYSADGARLVATAADMVRIWDATNGALLHELKHHGKPLIYDTVAISPDGNRVAAIDNRGDVAHVWDARSGALLAELRNDGAAAVSLAFSSDGRWLATSGGDVVHLFDTTTWTVARTLPARNVRSLSVDPTGPRLATGATDGAAAIWDIASGARIRSLREIGEPVDRVAYAANGELVITAARDGAEQVWDARSGRLRSQLNPRHSRIVSIELDRTSTLVVASSVDGAVVVSDVAQGMPIAVLEGSKKHVSVVHFDPSSRRVLGASWDGTARIWNATSPYRRWSSPPVSDGCGLLSLEPDRRFVAIGCVDKDTRVWDTAHDRLLAELPAATQLEGAFSSSSPAVSADGDRAAIARGNTVVIYELPGGRPLRTIMHRAAVSAVAFAPTGHELVSGTIDGALLVTREDREPVMLPASPDAIDAAAVLSDGRVVAAAGNRLRIFDLDRNTTLADLEVAARVGLLRPSSQGPSRLITIPRFTSGNNLGRAVLWDLERYRVVAELNGRAGSVFTARFVGGDREILTTGVEDAVQLWDSATGQLRQTFRGSSRFFVDATLSPDGSMVVAAAADGLLRFWDVTNERPLWTLQAHRTHVAGLHFEGDDLVTRGFGGDVSRWHLPRPEEVIGIAIPPVATAVP